MERKNFKITFSLKEGYAKNAKRHRIDAVEKVITLWMEKRLSSGEPLIGGFLHEGKLIYPAQGQQPDGVIIEPTGIFEGELSSQEDIGRADKEVRGTLNSLAEALKAALGQQSVFVSYRNKHWCV